MVRVELEFHTLFAIWYKKKDWYKKRPHPACVCVPFIINQTPAAGGDHCHGPQRAALSGLWAIPSTESGPQPLLVTYNLSSLALTPGEPTPYVCMYVSMVCGMYVSMCWVKRESTQVHREGGTVVSKGKKSSVCGHDGASSQGTSYVRGCSGASLSEVWVVSCA